MTRVLSGIQPTNAPHLGNYLGALRNWIALQDQADTFYCVVDLHALTVPRPPSEVGDASRTMATLLLAAGLDPARCTLFLQSHVAAHPRLGWLLECTAAMGELARMTQWKDKSARGGADDARVGLFTYPTLMAADILLYDADRVPVGDDQRQHLELTRDLAQRWNSRYGPTFVVPEALIPAKGGGGRVMDLQDPTRKMSKSADSDAGTIMLLDDPKVVERKVKRAVTDPDASADPVRYDPAAKPGVSNLLDVLGAVTGRPPAEVAAGYTRYGPLKADVAAAVVDLLTPLQARYAELAADPGYVLGVLADGAARASEVAEATLARASEAVGLLPPAPPR
ncbi:MAG TPA: tryptophan--tRNA ligase [Acidimicrobiales bacterium]|nr:tryptophan--tRNA ligase [Acidimicrobiales bacterium]